MWKKKKNGKRKGREPKIRILPLIMKYKTTKKLPRKLKNNYTKHTQGQVLEQQYRMVLAYRRGKNLGDYLVHSKFSELNDKQNKRRSCRYVGGVGGRVFELPQLIPLNRTNCVYLMSCNECGKKHYGYSPGLRIHGWIIGRFHVCWVDGRMMDRSLVCSTECIRLSLLLNWWGSLWVSLGIPCGVNKEILGERGR